MPARRYIQIGIHGRTYRLAGPDPDRTRMMARQVHAAMTRLEDAMPGTEELKLAVLAAVHLADELSSLRDEYRDFRASVGGSAERMLRAIGETDSESDGAADASREAPEASVEDSPSEAA